MPETYGLPEDEPVLDLSDRVAQVVAGQGILRRIVLYLVVFMVMPLGMPFALLGLAALVMLIATDKGLV